MIESVIRWSVGNRFFVLLATLLLLGWSSCGYSTAATG